MIQTNIFDIGDQSHHYQRPTFSLRQCQRCLFVHRFLIQLGHHLDHFNRYCNITGVTTLDRWDIFHLQVFIELVDGIVDLTTCQIEFTCQSGKFHFRVFNNHFEYFTNSFVHLTILLTKSLYIHASAF